MKNKEGFTLIELVVSMSIAVLVMISFSVVFAGIIKNYKKAKNINENMLNIQHALNLVGKTIRTSTLRYPTSGPNTGNIIVIYDYSQGTSNPGLCIRYAFEGNYLNRSFVNVTESNCNLGATFSTAVPMTSGTVNGQFYTIDSNGDESAGTSERVGRVTIRASLITGYGTAQTKSTDIQTSVSLRDYSISNVGIDVN